MKDAASGDVAVVIVNHNTSTLLAACLDSLSSGGSEGVASGIWVVDNASTDDSVACLRNQFPAVDLIASSENLGFGAANNLALRAIGLGGPEPAYRYALILNPDTIVPQGALRRMVDDLDAEPDAAVLGPKLVLPDGSLDLACRRAFPTPEVAFYRFSGLSRLFPKHPRFGRYNMSFLDPDRPADLDSVVGACMLVRAAAAAEVGLFDERFWMYGEDLDWCLRFHQAGWRVIYRPRTVVYHIKRAASRGSRRARYEFQRAMWLFYAKHYAARSALAVHLLVMLGLGLRGGPRLLREMWRDRSRSALR